MTNHETPLHRRRFTYAKGEALRYISHLDLARTWERAFRRAGLPVAYSQGFNPKPRFQIAAALPVGVTGLREMVDVWLLAPMSSDEALCRLRPVLPRDLGVTGAEEVDLRAPALQARQPRPVRAWPSRPPARCRTRPCSPP